MALEAEKDHYHEIEYLFPRLSLSLYWQVESSPWSVIHMLRLPAPG